jgi:hypothetical protein
LLNSSLTLSPLKKHYLDLNRWSVQWVEARIDHEMKSPAGNEIYRGLGMLYWSEFLGTTQ